MTTQQIIVGIVIHLGLPLLGLVCYLSLLRKIKHMGVDQVSSLDLFLLFFTYGGLLMVVLTSLFWQWSGLASLGLFYLLFVGPVVMGFIAYRNFKRRALSVYHQWIHRCTLGYFPLFTLALLLFLLRN